MPENAESLSIRLARPVVFALMGPILLNPLYSFDNWSMTWVYSKTETFYMLCGCVLWGLVAIGIVEMAI